MDSSSTSAQESQKSNTLNQITELIDDVERRNGVSIILAVENGSRAWGFESPLSDYDVRFIYHHSPSWYVSAFSRRDNIDLATIHNIDAAGWDITKLMRLLYKGNASVYEWLNSPIVYRQDPQKCAQLRELAEKVFNPDANFRHYLALAKKRITDSRRHPKRFLYLIRAVLSARYISDNNSPPPVLFSALSKSYLPGTLDNMLAAVIENKNTLELSNAWTVPLELWKYVEHEFAELGNVVIEHRHEGDSDVYDRTLRAILGI